MITIALTLIGLAAFLLIGAMSLMAAFFSLTTGSVNGWQLLLWALFGWMIMQVIK